MGNAVFKSREEHGLASPKDAKILDAGCGTGAIGKILHAQGYTDVHG